MNDLKTIENINEDNLREIAALYIECFNAPNKGENWTSETAYEYFLERKNEHSIFAVVTDKNKIRAVCCGGPFVKSFISKELEYNFEDCAYISLLAVSQNFRGQGIGKKLLQQYCTILKSKKFKTTLIRCRSNNAPMIGVLKHHNFQLIHEYTSELGGIVCERSVFVKNL